MEVGPETLAVQNVVGGRHQQHHQRAYQKCRIAGSTPDLQNQSAFSRLLSDSGAR